QDAGDRFFTNTHVGAEATFATVIFIAESAAITIEDAASWTLVDGVAADAAFAVPVAEAAVVGFADAVIVADIAFVAVSFVTEST
ncbi:hypothetical protein, partial [Acinetobacter baumannii]|uniref:hypothetical protein n=1 Tax=Acinetobacter baumannii TaxID=470 RepID=UPI003D6AA76E